MIIVHLDHKTNPQLIRDIRADIILIDPRGLTSTDLSNLVMVATAQVYFNTGKVLVLKTFRPSAVLEYDQVYPKPYDKDPLEAWLNFEDRKDGGSK